MQVPDDIDFGATRETAAPVGLLVPTPETNQAPARRSILPARENADLAIPDLKRLKISKRKKIAGENRKARTAEIRQRNATK